MSISSALNNALTGLTATSRMAEVVSSNLSNVLTDGYGRRSVELSSAQLGGTGGGVRVSSINRFVDAGLLADRRLADAALTGQQDTVTLLSRLENTLGGPDDPANLGAKLAAFETALISATSDPASDTRLTAVVRSLSDIATTLQSNTRSIQSLRQEADTAVARNISQLNTALRQIEDLNVDLLRIKSLGEDTSALLDARQNVIDQIAEIVPVRQIERENGTVGLITTSGTTLLDHRAVQFGFEVTPTITADMTFESGALGGITLDGTPLDTSLGVGRLGGGALGAAFEARDKLLTNTQSMIDEIAVDLIARFQDSATDPTLVSGDAGLLTDDGGPLDLLDIPGVAGRIAINAVIDPNNNGDVRLLRDGLNSPIAGPSGNAKQLNMFLDALTVQRADAPGMVQRSAAGRIDAFAASLGAQRINAENALSYTTARWNTLHEAELSNGVDTDVELQTLMRVEQAYAANARVIEAADFMMQRLMEI